MKKVCIFANSMFTIGGEQRVTSHLVNGLIKKGYEVTVLIKNKEPINYNLYNLSKNTKLIFLNYTYDFRLNNSKFFEYLRVINRKTGIFKNSPSIIKKWFCSKKMINDLKAIFKVNSFDVVIGVAGDRSFILASIKEYLNNAKLIHWNHQDVAVYYINKYSRYYNEKKFIDNLMYKFDEVISLNNKDTLKLRNLYKGVKINTIYNCKSFTSLEKSNLNNNRFIACGRLANQKGFDLLIDSMFEFNKKNKDYKLYIYGEGPLKNKLEKRIKKYNLQDYVFIKNNTDKIKEEFISSDIFLMSSRYEGFGLVTLEALECGLPVIGYDIAGSDEIVKSGINGYLVKPYHTIAFADKMLYLVNNKEKLKLLQKNIPGTIQKFDTKIFIETWIKHL